jgi:hypothetical protein
VKPFAGTPWPETGHRWLPTIVLTVLASGVLTAGVLQAAVLSAATTTAVAGDSGQAPQPRLVATSTVAPAPVQLSFAADPATAVVAAPPQTAPQTTPEPAPATAPVDDLCSGQGWQQRRGDAALAGLRRPSDADVVRVEFLPARGDMLGAAFLEESRVEVYVRSCSEQSAALLRHVVAHELGHVMDISRMTESSSAAYLAARGIAPGTSWFGCHLCTDFSAPAGDFAEVYAQWQCGTSTNRSQLAAAPAAVELDRLAATFFS